MYDFNKVKIKPLEELELIRKSELPEEVYEQEKEEMYLSEYLITINDETYNPYCYLYHGIRFQNYLEKLESIFKDQKILAGKYIPNYFNYNDNCNKGEYVSLTSYNDSMGFNVFIVENISLLVTPKCNAYLTKCVSYENWEKIKNKKTKNLYSYMFQEYMCKDFISLDLVKSVGVPYNYYLFKNGIEYADNILNDVKSLINKYNINISIVDTSNFNNVLFDQSKVKVK